MDLKDTAAVFSAPAATRKPLPKIQNQVSQSSGSGNDGQISNANAVENGNDQSGEGMLFISYYIMFFLDEALQHNVGFNLIGVYCCTLLQRMVTQYTLRGYQ